MRYLQKPKNWLSGRFLKFFSRFCKSLDLNALHDFFGKSAVFGRFAPPGHFGAVEGGFAEAKKHFPVKISTAKKKFFV